MMETIMDTIRLLEKDITSQCSTKGKILASQLDQREAGYNERVSQCDQDIQKIEHALKDLDNSGTDHDKKYHRKKQELEHKIERNKKAADENFAQIDKLLNIEIERARQLQKFEAQLQAMSMKGANDGQIREKQRDEFGEQKRLRIQFKDLNTAGAQLSKLLKTFTTTWYAGLEEVTRTLAENLGDNLHQAKGDWSATYKTYSTSLNDHMKRLESKKTRAENEIQQLREKKTQADDDDDADAWQEADKGINRLTEKLQQIQKDLKTERQERANLEKDQNVYEIPVDT